ncbi:MAG: hypothetical protein ACP5Q5_01700 [Brevinematia bacterium]
MFKESRKFFFIFLYFLTSSFNSLLAYIFASFITQSPQGLLIFIPFLYFFTSTIIIFILKTKLNYFLKSLLSFLCFLFFLLDLIFIYAILKKINISGLNLILMIVPNTVFFITTFSIISTIYYRFKKLDNVIENEAMFENRSKYIQWVNEEYGERMDKMEPKWFLSIGLNILSFLLILSFLSIAKNNFNKIFISFFILTFFFSFIGMYLILNQYSTIMKWKFLGFKIKEEIIKNWNNLLKILMLFIFISIFIPSNYVIFKIDFLTELLKSLFPVAFQINENYETPQGEENIISQNIAENFENFYNNTKKILLIIIALYLIFALIGLILKLIFKNKKPPFFARFFIFFYDSLVSFISKIKDFALLIIELISNLFKKKEKEEKKEDIAKHFYSMFGNYKKLPTEKQKEIETIVKEFIRLIQVASRFVLPYTFYYGPKEYMDKVSEKVTSASEEIKTVVEIFNESRYSLHLLSEEKKSNFKRQIDIIIDKITRLF